MHPSASRSTLIGSESNEASCLKFTRSVRSGGRINEWRHVGNVVSGVQQRLKAIRCVVAVPQYPHAAAPPHLLMEPLTGYTEEAFSREVRKLMYWFFKGSVPIYEKLFLNITIKYFCELFYIFWPFFRNKTEQEYMTVQVSQGGGQVLTRPPSVFSYSILFKHQSFLVAKAGSWVFIF